MLSWKRFNKLFAFPRTVSGRSAAWLARLVRDQEVEGSNPFAPTTYPETNQALLICNFRCIRGFGNTWEQNRVFEPFHGVPLPSGKHMRVPERSL